MDGFADGVESGEIGIARGRLPQVPGHLVKVVVLELQPVVVLRN